MLLLCFKFILCCALLNGGIMKVNEIISKIPPNLPLQREACRYAPIIISSVKFNVITMFLVFRFPLFAFRFLNLHEVILYGIHHKACRIFRACLFENVGSVGINCAFRDEEFVGNLLR